MNKLNLVKALVIALAFQSIQAMDLDQFVAKYASQIPNFDLSNVNATGQGKRTALQIAVLNNDIRAVETLLRLKANVDAQDDNGTTALMFAAYKGYFDIVQLLVNNNANINIRNKNNLKAVDYARQAGFDNIVEFLNNPVAIRVSRESYNQAQPIIQPVKPEDKRAAEAQIRLAQQQQAEIQRQTADTQAKMAEAQRLEAERKLKEQIATQAQVQAPASISLQTQLMNLAAQDAYRKQQALQAPLQAQVAPTSRYASIARYLGGAGLLGGLGYGAFKNQEALNQLAAQAMDFVKNTTAGKITAGSLAALGLVYAGWNKVKTLSAHKKKVALALAMAIGIAALKSGKINLEQFRPYVNTLTGLISAKLVITPDFDIPETLGTGHWNNVVAQAEKATPVLEIESPVVLEQAVAEAPGYVLPTAAEKAAEAMNKLVETDYSFSQAELDPAIASIATENIINLDI